jgi:hypothetical protein
MIGPPPSSPCIVTADRSGNTLRKRPSPADTCDALISRLPSTCSISALRTLLFLILPRCSSDMRKPGERPRFAISGVGKQRGSDGSVALCLAHRGRSKCGADLQGQHPAEQRQERLRVFDRLLFQIADKPGLTACVRRRQEDGVLEERSDLVGKPRVRPLPAFGGRCFPVNGTTLLSIAIVLGRSSWPESYASMRARQSRLKGPGPPLRPWPTFSHYGAGLRRGA